MNADALAPLEDILRSAEAIQRFVSGRTFEEFVNDELFRSAVERKFEIIGEALVRIRRVDVDLLGVIRGHREIVAFRNILVHGYDTVDEQIVWSVISNDLPLLLEDVRALLAGH